MQRLAMRVLTVAALLAVTVHAGAAERAAPPTTKSLLEAYDKLAGMGDSASAADKLKLAAHILRNSLPNSHSLAKIVTLVHAAAEAGNVDALYFLSELYRDGIHVNRDHEMAEVYRSRAVSLDMAAGRAAQIPLQLLTCSEMLSEDSRRTLAQRVKRVPDADAYFIGWCYLTSPYKELYAEGVQLAKRAAEAGDTNAQLALGALYEEGRFLASSPRQAGEWYMRAFNSIDRSATSLEAGYRYLQLWLGGKVKEDMVAIRGILTELVRSNNPEGKLLAAQLAFSDKLQLLDPAEMFRLASDAALAGYGTGYLLAAVCHERGLGTRKDWAKAAEFYRKAGKSGLAVGSARLGDIYAMGLGQKPDAALALAAYQEAVDLGYTAAQKNLTILKQKAGLAGATKK